jgi:hypothetical protein
MMVLIGVIAAPGSDVLLPVSEKEMEEWRSLLDVWRKNNAILQPAQPVPSLEMLLRSSHFRTGSVGGLCPL